MFKKMMLFGVITTILVGCSSDSDSEDAIPAVEGGAVDLEHIEDFDVDFKDNDDFDDSDVDLTDEMSEFKGSDVDEDVED